MNNPTRQEIINAHEALEDMHHIARKTTEKWDEEGITDFWKSLILRALPPKPQPTMAEVEWDSDKHYLTEAEHPGLSKVIMIDKVFYTEDTYIYVLITDEDETYGCLASPSNLTPTGKRYTLTEEE